jgi:hypothetical protein
VGTDNTVEELVSNKITQVTLVPNSGGLSTDATLSSLTISSGALSPGI